MLVESLVVSSREFSFFSLVLEIYQKSQIHSFLCSHFFVFHRTSLFHSLLSFSFHSFKHWRTFNTHVNQPVMLLSPPVLMDSTCFSLFTVRKYRGSQSTHTLNLDFKTYSFCARFSPDQILVLFLGMRTVWFHVLLTFLLCFWCAG